MAKRDFDRAMPVEFWREVVDRVAAEAPDTLLLAEAFWLMEGYFVRTLGMHRVYNSAFMNMLRDEKNAEYRLVMKNTIDFDPQILKRYVNFMNNPDERTAIDQFGDGDKYFGVCTLMVTMPGLPMFGHGQIEGFTEKYGMEFRRAGLAEEPKEWLVERHQREIFPLLHRRHLFAEVDDFLLYDFYTAEGHVNEDVFAYSNRRDGERSLVVYHNRYAETNGWIRVSPQGGRTLAQGLALDNEEARYLVMRDQRSGLQYLRNARQLHDEGLYLELTAYGCHVFLDMYEVQDADGRYGRLAAQLAGGGVPDIELALREMELAPLHAALREESTEQALAEVARLLGLERPPPARRRGTGSAPEQIDDLLARRRPELSSGAWVDEWLIDRALPDADLLALRLDLRGQAGKDGRNGRRPAELIRNERFRRAIGVNRYEGVEWFNKERFERAVAAIPVTAATRRQLLSAAERSGYRFDRLEAEFEPRTDRPDPRKRAATRVGSSRKRRVPANAKRRGRVRNE
jgi:hypothetical protein